MMPKHLSSSRHLAISLLIIATALVAIISGTLRSDDALSAEPLEKGDDVSIVYPSCRYGVAALGAHQVDWVDEFRAGWYLNFSTAAVSAPNNAEFAAVITVKQDKTEDGEYLSSYSTSPPLTDTGLGSTIDASPGSLWIVGNEVDRGPDPGQTVVNQGDTYPEIYARAYHDVYHFIKNLDPSAQVANSALVQVTPGRLQYLDIMWNSYLELFGTPMPVDVWNMHIYILPEVSPNGEPNAIANIALGTDPALAKKESYDPDGNGPLEPKDTCKLEEVYCFAEHDDMNLFVDHVIAMRNWMDAHGQQNKPLILSEFSILYPYVQDPGGTCFIQDEYGQCFTHERVIKFLNSTFNFLETAVDYHLGYPQDEFRLVQQWLWFSINHGASVGSVSNLVSGSPSDLTAVGQAFQSAADNQEQYINLFSDHTSSPIEFTQTPTQTIDATLSLSVRNNGNITPLTPFMVTFYEDGALNQPIGTATVQPPGLNLAGVVGCARRGVTVEVLWEGLHTGFHRYWAEIDGDGWIIESDESDNIASGFVLVNPEQIFIPITVKP